MKNAAVKPCMTTTTEQQENSTYKYARLERILENQMEQKSTYWGTNCSNLDGKIWNRNYNWSNTNERNENKTK